MYKIFKLLAIFLPFTAWSQEIGGEVGGNVAIWTGGARNTFSLTDEILYPSREGVILKKGLNAKTFMKFFLIEQDEQTSLGLGTEAFIEHPGGISLHRLRVDGRWRFIKFSGGKDSFGLGPGRSKITLSENIPPQDFVRLDLGKGRLPWILGRLGKFAFAIGNMFVENWEKTTSTNTTTSTIKDPNLLFMRLEWEPIPFLALGGSRVVMWGGKGGGEPKGFREWLDFLTARLENARKVCERRECSEQEEEKYYRLDFNNIASYDVSLTLGRLAEKIDFEYIRDGKIYVEHGADDIKACWQIEDVKMPCFPSPIRLPSPATVFGGYILAKWGFMLAGEYAHTLAGSRKKIWYQHRNYPLIVGERYSGLRIGPDSDSFWLKLGYIKRGASVSFRFEHLRRGVDIEKGPEKTTVLGIQGAYDVSDRLSVGASIHFILSDNFVKSLPSPQEGEPWDFSGKKSEEFLLSILMSSKL